MLTLKDGRLFSLYEKQIFQTDNDIKFWAYQCAHTISPWLCKNIHDIAK